MNSVDVGLTILVYTTALVVIVVGGFLAKLIYDLSEFAKSAKSTSDLIQTELEPTLKELQETMVSIKSIASTADSNFASVKDAVGRIIEKSSSIGAKFKGMLSGIVKGVEFGLKLFRRK